MSIGAAYIDRNDENKTREELLLELKALRSRVAEGDADNGLSFRMLADVAQAGILVHQGEETIYANQAMADIEGYPLEELLRMKFWEPVHPDFRDGVIQRSEARQRGEAVPVRNELKIVRKNGDERWITSSAGTISFKGKPMVVLVVQDITTLKQAEEALKKSQYILAKAQEIAHVGNWAWNLRSGQMNWSEETYRIFGYEPGEVRPSIDWVMTRVHPDDKEVVKAFTDEVTRIHRRKSVDYRIIRPDGSIRFINSVADKIVIGKRSRVPERVYGINQDITERKKAEEALNTSKNEAELYVDLMGHDINNMNQITMGYLELAHNILDFEGKLSTDHTNLLDRAIDSLNNSSRLIDNVRKLQREKMGLYKPELMSVNGILEEVVGQFAIIPGRDVSIDYRSEEDCCIKANLLLKDVFINLLGNSIKHSTGPLNIWIRANQVQYHGRSFCRASIEDDGPGIPDPLKKTLFDRLNLASTRARGKGFGLCLIKILVDDFNGMFWVEDRVPGDHKKGARFVVMLPAVEK